MRWFIYLSYNGTAYHGWQYQPNGVSVQELLEQALSTVLREKKAVTGAGRTDSGVHAAMMVAHVDINNIPDDDVPAFVKKLNSILPKDIAVHQIIPVKEDAHARFDATSRKYEYRIFFGKNVFKGKLATRMYHPLNFELMNEAAAEMLRYRDFTSFSKLHTDARTNNCVIAEAFWKQEGDEWVFHIRADRFLRNMVRAVVGTLFEVGIQKITVKEFCDIIEAKNRCMAGVSVPPQGLYLVDIRYPDEIFLR
jgi:tRNA pseudouridine38-40 synthase